MRSRLLMMLLMLVLVSGCSYFNGEEEDPVDNRPAEVIYEEGVRAVKREKYKIATRNFETIDQKYPFSSWAVLAQRNLIYAYYKDNQPAEAISAAERFIRLHPRHKDVSYAYYMRGLSFYIQISDANRDQSRTKEAQAAFEEVVSRFPNSDYAVDARQRLKLIVDRLTAKEVVVGRYYLDREEYIAAINRFRVVVEDKSFSVTPYIEEALFSMALASYKLGLYTEAKNYITVLGHNYPESVFYRPGVEMMAGRRSPPSGSELDSLRRGVDEGFWGTRFFQGLAPGIPGM